MLETVFIKHLDNFVDYIVDQGKVCKVILLYCDQSRQANKVLDVLKNDWGSYLNCNIFMMLSLGTDNFKDAVRLIKDLNDIDRSYLDSSKFVTMGADVSQAVDIPKDQFEIINCYNQSIEKEGWFSWLTTTGGGNKVAEGVNSSRRCVDLLIYVAKENSPVSMQLEPLQIFQYVLPMLKDIVIASDKETDMTNIFTDICYAVVEVEKVNDQGESYIVLERERVIRKESSINLGRLQLIPISSIEENIGKSNTALARLEEKGITGMETLSSRYINSLTSFVSNKASNLYNDLIGNKNDNDKFDQITRINQ